MVWEIIIGALKIFGALGFFLYGMKTMSEGLQQVAGSQMRNILGAMTTNKYTGVLTGFLITAILQSSSATTVMTVSFVNAGLISLMESAGVMMGANIGTTITGWLVSLIGFKFKIANIALPMIAVGLPFLFSSKEKMKKWGEVLIGFALLFLGLEALKDSVPDLRENQQVLEFLAQFNNPGILSRLLFVLIGTLLTVVMQSSSAAMTLTIALTLKGLPLDIAAAMVLGENIGTTITAELASMVANVHAKRSARIHSLFNIIGVTWMIILAPFFIEFINYLFPISSDGYSNKFALAAFHTGFNLLNVLLLLGFVNTLVKFATRTVKAKGDDDEEFHLEFIDQSVFSTSALTIEEARKAIIKYAEVVSKMSSTFKKQFAEEDIKQRTKLNKKIKKAEDITDELEEQISDFLVKVLEAKLSPKVSKMVKGYLSIITDLERIADIILRMSMDLKRKDDKEVVLSDAQIKNLKKLSKQIDKAMDIMLSNFNSDSPDMEAAMQAEKSIDKLFKKLRKEHFNTIDTPDYDTRSGIIYRDLYHSYEKIGDHVINVSEALTFKEDEDDE